VRFGLTIPTPRKMDDRLFFTTFLQRLTHVQTRDGQTGGHGAVAHGKTQRDGDRAFEFHHVHAVSEEGYIYGVCSYGQLRCLKADTGERVWESFQSYDCRRQGAVGKRLSGEERRPVFSCSTRRAI